MSPVGSAPAELAHAASEVAKVGRSSPRFAITAVALVACLGLILGFIYLLMTRPEQVKAPIATSGNWLTQDQFRAELADRDKRLTPATNDALDDIRASIESLRDQWAKSDAVREERSKAVLDVVSRVETRLETQGARVDRLYERIIGK